jgi:hypothetical protein
MEKKMIKWLGEIGEELVGTNRNLCVQNKGSLCIKQRIFVYKTKDLCIQIRFLCRLHRKCSSTAQEYYVKLIAQYL